MASSKSKVVILGTGGTIAGTAASPADNLGYRAAQVGVAQLVAAVPALSGVPIEAEQVAQLDSKDMRFSVWRQLGFRIEHHLARDEVAGIVVTHGTDTLEETAYFLHSVLAPAKPVVLTAAMRPATSLQADGPQNLCDAVALAREPGARGVLAVLAGRVLAGNELRKMHSYRLDAFGSGDAGALAVMQEGIVRRFREWPLGGRASLADLPDDDDAWPWVEIVSSHAGASARAVDALVAAGVRGLVVAATGNGTLHEALVPAFARAASRGVTVLRASRCASGGVLGSAEGELESAGSLTPVQARVALVLRLARRR